MEKLVPKLRFPEFQNNETIAYRKYGFNDIFNFSTGKNIKQSEASPEFEIPCVRYGELYHMYNEVIYNVINKTNLEKSELIFSNGDEILLPSAGEDPLDIGSASALTIENIAIGRTINILSPKNKNIYSPIYVSYYINQKLKKKIASLAKGVSISNVYNSDLKTLNIKLPSFEEQQKIASFLTSVDARLTLLAQQKEKLEQYKKGVMQQIFAQKLRFKDENGKDYPNWEEKKLGKVCELIHGYQFRSSDFKESGIAIIKISNVIGQNLNLNDLSFIDEKRYNEFKKFEIQNGDILMSLTGNIGRVIEVVNKPFTLIQNYRVGKFVPVNLNKLSSRFLKYLLMSDLVFGRFNQLSNQSAQANFGKQDMDKIKISLPCLEEQQKIASFLSAIDVQIEGVSKKIEQTKLFKKGLLQQMFV